MTKISNYPNELVAEPSDDDLFDVSVEISPGVFQSNKMKYSEIKRLGVAITIDVIPKGTGTNIEDGDWGFTAGAIHPLITDKDIGIIASKLIKTIYGKDFTIGELPADTGSLYLAHPDRFNDTDYALNQNSAGTTFLNGVAQLSLTVNDTSMIRLDAGLLRMIASSGDTIEYGTGIGANTGALKYVKGLGSDSSTFTMDLVNSLEALMFRFRDDGRFGIGITSMTAVLDIKGGSVTEAQFRLRSGLAQTLTDRKEGSFANVSGVLFFYPADNAAPINLTAPLQSTITQEPEEDLTTAYLFTNADHGKIIELSNAAAIALTLNTGLRSDFACTYVQKGAGQITISGTATLNSPDGFLVTEKQHVAISVIPSTTVDNYTLAGRLVP